MEETVITDQARENVRLVKGKSDCLEIGQRIQQPTRRDFGSNLLSPDWYSWCSQRAESVLGFSAVDPAAFVIPIRRQVTFLGTGTSKLDL
jgi:hypothetical protein